MTHSPPLKTRRAASAWSRDHDQQVGRPLLTPRQLAARHHTSVQHLANERCAGRGVPYIKINSKVLYALAQIEAYETANTVYPIGGAV